MLFGIDPDRVNPDRRADWKRKNIKTADNQRKDHRPLLSGEQANSGDQRWQSQENDNEDWNIPDYTQDQLKNLRILGFGLAQGKGKDGVEKQVQEEHHY